MPAIKFQDGSTLHDMTDIRFQDGATLRTITEAWFQDGSTLRKVWPAVVYVPMTVSVGNVSGSYTAGSGTHVIGNAYVSVSNGDSPYSYSWSVSGANLSVVSHGTYATVYSSQNTPGSYSGGTVTCTVTDATSHVKSDSGSVSYTVNSSYVPMTGSISPSSLSGTTTQQSGAWYTLGTATISVSGGDPGYTYAWSISGTGLRITGSTTGSSVTVQVDRSTVATRTGTLQCVTTDSTSHTMTKSISVSGTVNSSYINLSITSQPSSQTQTHSPSPRAGSEAISMSTSMTTANGTVGSIVYSIVNLSGDTGIISTSVSGDGTHSASISGTGTRGRFDSATYSVTFRIKATDGASTVYSNYITFTDEVL